ARCQCRRRAKAERVCSVQVDYELELGWLYNGQIGRLFALENPTGVESGLTIGIREARAVAREAAGRGKLTSFIDRRNGITCCQRHDLIALAAEGWVRADQQCSGARLSHSCECPVDLVFSTRAHDAYLLSEVASGILNTPQLSLKIRIGRVEQHCDQRGGGNQRADESQSLSLEHLLKDVHTCCIAARSI